MDYCTLSGLPPRHSHTSPAGPCMWISYRQRLPQITSCRRSPLRDYPYRKSPEVTPVGRLWPGPRLVGRIWSGVRVGTSFKIFPLRLVLHFAGNAGVYLRELSVGGNIRGMSPTTSGIFWVGHYQHIATLKPLTRLLDILIPLLRDNSPGDNSPQRQPPTENIPGGNPLRLEVLTLTDPRGGVLTLTLTLADPRGGDISENWH